MVKVGNKIRIIFMKDEKSYCGKKVLLSLLMISDKFMVVGVDVF